MGAYKLTEKEIGSTPTEYTHFVVTQPETINSEAVESVRRLTTEQAKGLMLGSLENLQIFSSILEISSASNQTKEFVVSDGFQGFVILIGPTSCCGVCMLKRTGDRLDFAQVYRSGSSITMTSVGSEYKLRITATKASAPPINIYVLVFAGTIEEAA